MAARFLNRVAGVGTAVGLGGFLVQECIYDVDGGHRAVIFDRKDGILKKCVGEGTHFKIPFFQYPTILDVRSNYRMISSRTGTKDLQMVNISLRVLSRPQVDNLPFIFAEYGADYAERILPSVGNEVLKSVVAQYDASELLTFRDKVSQQISQELNERANKFFLTLDDVSITHLEYGPEFTRAVEQKQVAQQDAERQKFVVMRSEQERQAAIIKAEGESEAARLVSDAVAKSGSGFIEVQRIDAAREIAETLAKSRNVTYLPHQEGGSGGVLLGLQATFTATSAFPHFRIRNPRAHPMAADAVWGELKAACAALRSARNRTERLKAVAQVQAFLEDNLRRQLVHKWRAWGLLLSSLLHVVKCDLQPYLSAPAGGASGAAKSTSRDKGVLSSSSSPAASSKRKVKSSLTAPKLEYWRYLRNEFAAVHAIDGPLLHLDPNGRECLNQLFGFAVAVIGRETSEGGAEDPHIVARMEEEAWKTIKLIVPYRVYCAVVDQETIRDVLELGLASLEHGNTIGLASSAGLRAEIIQQILKNCPFDLHDWLPRLFPFFGDWFSPISVSGGEVRLDSVQDAVPKLLEAVTDLMKSYFSSVGSLVLGDDGISILHCIQRIWKFSKYRPRVYQTEYVVQFLALLASNTPETIIGSKLEIKPKELLKTLKALVAMLLNPSEIQQLLLQAKPVRGSLFTSGGGRFNVLIDLEYPIASYFRCAADVIYHHDQLVTEMTIQDSVRLESTSPAGRKRARPISTTLAWEPLLEIICGDSPAVDDESMFSSGSSSALLTGKSYSSQAQENRTTQRTAAVQKQHVSWLLVVLAAMCRHGDFYLKNRIGDVMMLMDQLSQLLEAKDIDQRQYVALNILVQLSHLSAKSGDLCGDILDEMWQKIWQCLLRPDLPYAHATESAVLSKDYPGDVVLLLLSNCVSFGLVPHGLIAESQGRLWSLPVFRNGSSALVAASRNMSASNSSVSTAPVRLLSALLRCIELQDEKSDGPGDHLSQITSASETPLGPGVLRASLLSALFSYLEIQASHEMMTSDVSSKLYGSPVSPVAYASAVLSFIQPSKSSDTMYLGASLAPKLLRILSQPAGEFEAHEFDGLHGFGVHFTLHEDGLAKLYHFDPEVPGPHSFSPVLQEFIQDSSFHSTFQMSNTPTASQDNFEHLKLPTELLAPLVQHSEEAFNFAVKKSHRFRNGSPSISRETQLAMHGEISRHFARLVTDLAAKFHSVGAESRGTMQSLASAMNVGLILACLYTEPPRPVGGDGIVDVPNLLKKFLGIIADNLKVSAFEHAIGDESASQSIVQVLMGFHSFILILQGKASLVACSHPSAEPVDLQIPSELRPAIRKIVGAIEEGVTLVATGTSAFTSEIAGSQINRSSSSQSLFAPTPGSFTGLSGSSGGDWSTSASSSQTRSTPPSHGEVVARDDFDDGNEHQRTGKSNSNPRTLKKISLWCFRVLLLLKKESGLKMISNLATDVEFAPDFLLALSALLCGVAGCDSLELLLKMVDYATDEASREGRKSRLHGGSFRTALFNSQALTVLKLAGLVHEKRKRQLKEEIPEQLVLYTRKYLDEIAAQTSSLTLRIGRKAELECLEVFFRLGIDTFGDFIDTSMKRLLDDDFSVRMASVCGIQSLFYMYPEGGPQLFKDLYHHLLPILPDSCPRNDGEESQPASQQARETGSVEICLTVALALYVSACSNEDVIPEVLVVCMRLASSDEPLYSSSSSSFLHSWLKAISHVYSYPTVLRLLDDHFCYLWSHYVTINMHGSNESEDQQKELGVASHSSAKELLEQFPMKLFSGSNLINRSVGDVFADKIDIIFPVGVLYDCLGESGSLSDFAFVNELVEVFFDSQSTTSIERLFIIQAAVEEQLITDLFALSFVLQSSSDPALQEIAARMLSVAEEKASTSALSISHLGHVVCKIARFTIWDLARVGDQPSESDLWKQSITNMKEKYSGFDWSRMNLAELLSEFYVMLLRTKLSGPISARAVHCFYLFVREVESAFESSFVLQQFLLRISFQVIKQLASGRKEVARRLTLLVRESCEQFMKSPDIFGKYLSFVVHEISDILSRSDSVGSVSLDEDGKGNLEWVVFAVCNNMANGLGKYILDIDAVPMGVSSSLDKLSLLVVGSRNVATPGEGSRKSLPSSASMDSRKSVRQIEAFVKKANEVGNKFYLQSRLIRSSTLERVQDARLNEDHHSSGGSKETSLSKRTPSTSLLRLSTVEKSVGELGESFDPTNSDEGVAELIGKLTKTLFYLSSHQKPTDDMHQSSPSVRESGVLVAIADALSAVGSLDRNTIDLNPGSDTAYLSRLYHEQFNRGALRETKVNFLPAMYERVLVYLSSLLFEENELGPDVIQQAVIALKNLLSIDERCDALTEYKDVDLKEFLEPFVHSPPSNWSSSSLNSRQVYLSNAKVPGTRQHHAQLWKSGGDLGFDEWIRSLTSYLASKSNDLVLQKCTTLIAARTEMAVFLFPYTLWSVMSKVSPDEDSSQIATVVQTGVSDIFKKSSVHGTTSDLELPNDTELIDEPVEIVQLLVHSISFLREVEKAQFVESNGKSMTSKDTDKAPASKSKARSTQHLNQKAYGCLIEVDLLDVALAAIRVKMPYSAMQYVEMWLEEKNGGKIPSMSSSNQEELDEYARRILVDANSFDDNVDGIYGINDGRTLESQLITYKQERSYANALPIYDVSLQSRSDGSATQRTQLLEGMFMSLRNLGYQNLLEGYLESLGTMTSPATKTSPQIDEYKYELAWKNLQWGSAGTRLSSSDAVESGTRRGAPYCHQKVLFQSLKALAHRDNEHLQVLISKSKEEILKSVQLSLCGLEITRDSHRALLWLESIRDIEEAATVVMGSTALGEGAPIGSFRSSELELKSQLQKPCAESTTLASLFEQWQRRYSRIQDDFDAIDNLVALQEVLIKVADAPNTHQILSRLHLSLASFSRKANRVAVAYSALTKLEQLDGQGHLDIYQKMQWKMEKAKLLWTQKEARSAIWTAKLLRSELDRTLEDPEFSGNRESLQMLQVAVLTVTGKWIASQRSENSQVIIEDYFQKATDLVDFMDATVISQRVGDAAKAHLALADYMADMYHQVNTRVTSREWLAGKRVAEARHRELKECLAMEQAKQMENRAHIHALNKEVTYDHEERSKVEASVGQFLTGALRSYGKGLALSPKAELAVVFRLLSLWFSNQLKASTNKVIQEVIEVVPSYKFVPLSYQIMSRIGGTSSRSKDASDAFQQALSVLVLKLCEQHPHHALVQLIALKNSGDVEGKGAMEFRANVGDAKSEGAKQFVEKLLKTSQRELLESLDILSNAYIQLALFDTREYHKLGKKIPLSDVPIVGLHPGSSHHAISFDQCLRDRTRRGSTNRTVMPGVLTCNVTPRADMDYSSVVRVLSFEPMFSITDSGIHRPKIIYCYGSDGRRFKQLVKGKDDTRQDLVIEQAFETVNHFLKEDKQTRERKLRLRTYKVVPLSPIAGVLEWVDNTIPWGSYLVGRTAKRLSAHERYHPHERKHTDCRIKLKSASDKFAAYKEIEASFTPVFHHFFLEKFPDPAMWYHRRLAYVRSVAVTSIVGYILGIGDRHSQNILVHEETAELVHIDFGVVFDQGMALFTPETVPFRLTRDIVDGMGISGCEGVFTRCCEATLQLLRKKSASVVTILEVFVHDPLYRWTLSPLKALRIQEGGTGRRSAGSSHHRGSHVDDSASTSDATDATGTNQNSSSNNDAAARALIRVKQKLEGYEDPNGNALSIEGQVKQLISAAQDPHNLCSLFPGWAPWL